MKKILVHFIIIILMTSMSYVKAMTDDLADSFECEGHFPAVFSLKEIALNAVAKQAHSKGPSFFEENKEKYPLQFSDKLQNDIKKQISANFMKAVTDEIFLKFFGFLSPRDVGCVLSVCRQFNAIAHDDALWEDFRKINFPDTFETPQLQDSLIENKGISYYKSLIVSRREDCWNSIKRKFEFQENDLEEVESIQIARVDLDDTSVFIKDKSMVLWLPIEDLTLILPGLYRQLKNVRQLRLSNLPFTYIHRGIRNLLNLTDLNLGNYQVSSFPSEMVNLKQLKRLQLINMMRGKSGFPEGASNVITLETLVLSGCPFTAEIGKLTALTSLSLSGRGWQDLPPEFLNLVNLKSLNLYFISPGKLPEEIRHLTSLTELKLVGCPITEYPNWLSELSGLKISGAIRKDLIP
jgi:hypothetical protein